ncbi:CLUMA_CG002689, isoform A [Clunio marinus]|uniref:CLUMA_CG002689, isoform A n=1 Tax=Clunio marinus TaxID=568069 RepID=A0A1J1HNW3_9DIPT|nr:CLUMA_CG002689, isoform A [Clunio marinus]
MCKKYSPQNKLTHSTLIAASSDSPSIAKQVETKMFSCTRCQRKYKFRKTLNRHMNHECGKDKSHSCSACTYRTYRNDRLLSHIRMVHPSIAPSSKRGRLPRIENVISLSYPSF